MARERFRKVLCDKTMKKVHDDVLTRIMKAPVNTFFDVTPNGSIMKRFSEDMGRIETMIKDAMMMVEWGSQVVSTLFLVCQQNNYNIVICVSLLYLFYHWITDYGIKISRRGL